MSALFFYLLHNQDILLRVTAEIRATFTNEDEIRMGPKLKSCTFLQACINETMRLIPAVPNVTSRYVQAGGLVVDGRYIPEGVIVGTSLYTLQRNRNYFQDPDTFRPERWILNPEIGVDVESINLAQKAFCPFSIGPRSCVGWKLAWVELNVVLARTLFLYDMRLVPGELVPGAHRCTDTPGDKACDYLINAWAISSGKGGAIAQFERRAP
jgi:cytochrome P450